MLNRNIEKNRMNRQPTLHEYSMFAMKLRLVDDVYAIKYPIAACEPLNADFDGDTIAIHLVPEEAAEDTFKKMSPRYVNVYKKSGKPIFPFNHETLNGLCALTEYTFDDPNELLEPRYFYDDYATLLKDVEVEKKIKYGTPIIFTGKVGNETYQSQRTCYGRLRISKILDADVDKINILSSPEARIDAKAATKLSSWLNNDDKGVEKRKALQELALRAVTATGVATFDYKTLYTDTNTETYKKVREVADSPDLTDKQKMIILTELYKKYEKEVEGGFSEDLKNELNRAGRVKLSSITSLNMPMLIISGVDEIPSITHGSLLNGFTEKDMIVHSIENRSLQSIKQSAVQFLCIRSCGAHFKLLRIAGTNIVLNQKLNILNQQLVYEYKF